MRGRTAVCCRLLRLLQCCRTQDHSCIASGATAGAAAAACFLPAFLAGFLRAAGPLGLAGDAVSTCSREPLTSAWESMRRIPAAAAEPLWPAAEAEQVQQQVQQQVRQRQQPVAPTPALQQLTAPAWPTRGRRPACRRPCRPAAGASWCAWRSPPPPPSPCASAGAGGWQRGDRQVRGGGGGGFWRTAGAARRQPSRPRKLHPLLPAHRGGALALLDLPRLLRLGLLPALRAKGGGWSPRGGVERWSAGSRQACHVQLDRAGCCCSTRSSSPGACTAAIVAAHLLLRVEAAVDRACSGRRRGGLAAAAVGGRRQPRGCASASAPQCMWMLVPCRSCSGGWASCRRRQRHARNSPAGGGAPGMLGACV